MSSTLVPDCIQLFHQCMLSWIPCVSWWSARAWKVNWTCFLTKEMLKLYKNELYLVKCKYTGQALEYKYLFTISLLWVLFELQSLSKNSTSSSLFSQTDKYFFICFGSFWSWRMTITRMDLVLALLLFLSHNFIECFQYWICERSSWMWFSSILTLISRQTFLNQLVAAGLYIFHRGFVQLSVVWY